MLSSAWHHLLHDSGRVHLLKLFASLAESLSQSMDTLLHTHHGFIHRMDTILHFTDVL